MYQHCAFTDKQKPKNGLPPIYATRHATRPWLALCVMLSASSLAVIPNLSIACDGPKEVREATVETIERFVRGKQMTVLTFTGYSGAEYEHAKEMMEQASRVLDKQDPAKTLINIGATEPGIGAVYELAKLKGFTTMGIVSTLARDEHVPLSKCVDYVFYVKDTQWGGRIPETNDLSPTSAAIVRCSTTFVGIGGGEAARDEMLGARQVGKQITFIPADMNHKMAREKAQKSRQPQPTDFRGAAHGSLANEP